MTDVYSSRNCYTYFDNIGKKRNGNGRHLASDNFDMLSAAG